MSLIVEAAENERTDRRPNPRTDRVRRRIDVTDLDAEHVEAFVRSNVDTDRVCLEHRGGHTYLLVEE